MVESVNIHQNVGHPHIYAAWDRAYFSVLPHTLCSIDWKVRSIEGGVIGGSGGSLCPQ